MRILILLRIGLLLLILAISGCSSIDLGSLDSLPRLKQEPSRSPEQTVRLQVERALNENRLIQAQLELHSAFQQGIGKNGLSDLAAKVSRQLLQVAEEATAAGDFETAGGHYRQVLEIYPVKTQQDTALPFSATEVNIKLEECADELMKHGLIAYRAGELVAAVDTWRRISSFHPDHGPSRVAISTAEQQLKALEKLAPGQPQ